MSNESDKSKAEMAVFSDFVTIAQLPIDITSVHKRLPPEPDLLCQHGTDGLLAFELVELCDPTLAQAFADPRPDSGGVQYIMTSDPSWSIMSKKLRKKYATEHPVELLCYTAGRIITPADVILPTIRPLLGSSRHTFRRAWLLSEGCVYEVWS